MHRIRNRGFTLIELLVVIAIISILISILLPSLSAARERSKAVVCSTQLRELAAAGFMYTNDNSVYPPCVDNYSASGWNTNKYGLDWLGIGDQFGAFNPGNSLDPSTGSPQGFAAAPRFGLLWRYYQNEKLILCPSDYAGPFTPNLMVAAGNGKFSYTMSAPMGLRVPERIPAIPQFVSEQITPSRAPLLVEEHPDGMNNQHKEGNFGAGVNPSPDGGDKLIARHGPMTVRTGIAIGSGTISRFMQGATNIGFADGHAETLRPSWGFGKTQLLAGNSGIPNNITGLLHYYGIDFSLLRMTGPEP